MPTPSDTPPPPPAPLANVIHIAALKPGQTILRKEEILRLRLGLAMAAQMQALDMSYDEVCRALAGVMEDTLDLLKCAQNVHRDCAGLMVASGA